MWQALYVFQPTSVESIPSNVLQLTVYLTSGSTGRFPRAGNVSNMPGQEGVKACYSPMTRSLDSLSYFLKAVIDQKPWDYDPSCDPIPWRDITLPKALRIGVLRDDGNPFQVTTNLRRRSSISRLFKSFRACPFGTFPSRTHNCSIRPAFTRESSQTCLSVVARGRRKN